jgi:hypothetical protein
VTKEPGVPANPIRRRVVRAALAATLSLVVLGGCTSVQRAPTTYAGVEDNFLEGCEQVAKSDDGKASDPGQEDTTAIASPATYCQCVFDAIEKKVPYSEFKKTKSRMDDEGGALPKSIREAYASCDPAEQADS